MILVVDFGSQTAHLIARRIKELGVEAQIVSPAEGLKSAAKQKPDGIIFSGGPASVYEKDSPSIEKEIFSLKIPILGICYGFQLTSQLLGGKVISGKKEYGPAEIVIKDKNNAILEKLSDKFTVWMSHGDEIVKLPSGFETVADTKDFKYAFVVNNAKNIFGLQFHPEVEHTEFGIQIFKNFIKICNAKKSSQKLNIEEIKTTIKEQIGRSFVIGAISGGVDSTVAGVLVADVIGNKFIPVYVENGLMREGTREHVEKIFKRHNIRPIVVDARKEMLSKLKGVSDSEKKRKIIGNFYIEVFEREMKKLIKSGKKVEFLLQGTIYSDVIESQGTKHSAKIKSHHNVGGLPENMKLKLLEPLRFFYKDEVRNIGKMLGLSDDFVLRQPFPGPGYAVRIMGKVTQERLEAEKKADVILLEELDKADIMSKIFISFPVMTNAFSTAVKGDGRIFEEVVAIRIVDSLDVMTANWTKVPYDVLQKISSRIVNEVPGISRVVYDITTKPPATMEWE